MYQRVRLGEGRRSYRAVAVPSQPVKRQLGDEPARAEAGSARPERSCNEFRAGEWSGWCSLTTLALKPHHYDISDAREDFSGIRDRVGCGDDDTDRRSSDTPCRLADCAGEIDEARQIVWRGSLEIQK